MALLTVNPTRLDEAIARGVASHANRRLERGAKVLTWGADEHVLLALAALGWARPAALAQPSLFRPVLTGRALPVDPQWRRTGTPAGYARSCLATAILPHIMKIFIDQERPDRLTIKGHLRGIPFSGKSEDAFPSGHALHVGALASAATLLSGKYRNAIWAIGTLLVATRIVLLAHWFTDVAAGLALGFGVERGIRHLTRPIPLDRLPRSSSET
jgi:membrane-associated phospholipid phosphatase